MEAWALSLSLSLFWFFFFFFFTASALSNKNDWVFCFVIPYLLSAEILTCRGYYNWDHLWIEHIKCCRDTTTNQWASLPLNTWKSTKFHDIKKKDKSKIFDHLPTLGCISSITFHLCFHKLNSSSKSIESHPPRAKI